MAKPVVVRPDANKIALRAMRAILDGAHSFETDILGNAVSCQVMRGSAEDWPPLGVDNLDKDRDGPKWPAPASVECQWKGGHCTLIVDCEYWKTKVGRYRHYVGARVRLVDHRSDLVWITIPAVIRDADDGTRATLKGIVTTFKRKGDNPELAQRLSKALGTILRESKLPRINDSKAQVEVGSIEIPSGQVQDPQQTFRRLVQIALLKMDIVSRGAKAKERGEPLVNLARFEIDAQELEAAEVESDEEAELEEAAEASDSVGEAASLYADPRRNLILYGPPGTGKTHRLIELQRQFNDSFRFVTFHQAYGYEDFIEGIRPKLSEAGSQTALTYVLEDGIFKDAVQGALRRAGFDGSIDKFCRLPAAERQARLANAPPYAVFIDEINRGNVARIFGELITLLELDKRLGEPRELILTLPHSRTKFGVPRNLYVFGTMNTADRSVEALDTALRRRFDFEELSPSPSLLMNFKIAGDIEPDKLLRAINRRLEVLYDRDHCIGHAYFLPLKDTPTLEALKEVFRNKLLPLLQEYFFGDWGKIGLVLGKEFVQRRDRKSAVLAEFDHEDRETLSERPVWELKDMADISSHAFRRIYEHVDVA